MKKETPEDSVNIKQATVWGDTQVICVGCVLVSRKEGWRRTQWDENGNKAGVWVLNTSPQFDTGRSLHATDEEEEEDEG